MKKRNVFIYLIIGLVFATSAAAVVFGIENSKLHQQLENSRNQTKSQIQVENFYQQAVTELSDSMRNLEVNLAKVSVSNDSQTQMRYLMKVESEADRALADLSMLPIGGEDVEKTSKFINQTSGYCMTLSAKLGRGEKLSDEEAANIEHLHKVALSYSNRFENILRNNNDASFTELFNSQENGGMYSGGADIKDKEDEIFDYPQLIYDGPFSDSVNKHTVDTSGQRMFAEEVMEKVKEQLSDFSITNVEHVGEANNETRVYIYRVTTGKAELTVHATVDTGQIVQFVSSDIEADNDEDPKDNSEQSLKSLRKGLGSAATLNSPISEFERVKNRKQGIRNPFKGVYDLIFKRKSIGHISSVSSDGGNEQEKKTLTDEDKQGYIATAQAIAKRLGFDVSPMWVSEPIDLCVYVNMCHVQNEYMIYPDMIMVSINTSTGEVNGMEAYAYLANHKVRRLPDKTGEDAAKDAVNKKLQIVSSKPVVIPFGSEEKFCFEFTCTFNGEKYFVYVEMVSNKEIEIKKIVDEGKGHMVM